LHFRRNQQIIFEITFSQFRTHPSLYPEFFTVNDFISYFYFLL